MPSTSCILFLVASATALEQVSHSAPEAEPLEVSAKGRLLQPGHPLEPDHDAPQRMHDLTDMAQVPSFLQEDSEQVAGSPVREIGEARPGSAEEEVPQAIHWREIGVPNGIEKEEDKQDQPGPPQQGIEKEEDSNGMMGAETRVEVTTDEQENSAKPQQQEKLPASSLMRREGDGSGQPIRTSMKRIWDSPEPSGAEELETHATRKFNFMLSIFGLCFLFASVLAISQASCLSARPKTRLPERTPNKPHKSDLQKQAKKKSSPCEAPPEADSTASTEPQVGKLVASLIEASLPCAASRKTGKEERDASEDDVAGELRPKVEALQVCTPAEVEKRLPSAGGYDVTFSKPSSSRQLLRLEAKIEGLVDTTFTLLSPLTQRPCVLYSASASRQLHAGVHPLPLAFATKSLDFTASLLDDPGTVITIAGSDVALFATHNCRVSEVLPFPCARDTWQDFVDDNPSGSADSHRQAVQELRAKGAAVEFQECALLVGAVVTLVGELTRDASGQLALQPLNQEQVISSKMPTPPQLNELLEARSNVLVSDDPELLSF